MRAVREARQGLAALADAPPHAAEALTTGAVRELFRAETLEDAEALASGVRAAMKQLSEALVVLNDARASEATMTPVADALAKLWPAVRDFERASAPPPAHIAAEAPVPLVAPRKRRQVVGLLPEDERRVQPRATLEVDIGFRSETNFFTGYSEDLSDGGIFVATYNLLPKGTALVVSFVLPSGDQITAHGRVAWTREPRDGHGDEAHPGMGVTFEGLSDDDRTRILAFVRKRPPMFYGE